MEVPAPHRPASEDATWACTGSTALFQADELLQALESYEDLPIDLILDDSADVVFEPLESLVNEDVSDSSASSSSDTLPSTGLSRSQKQKAEQEFLRNQITQLERQLATAKATRNLTKSSPWRDVAKRQRERRTVTERENACLRSKLLRQMQVAKSLQVVLQHRAMHGNLPGDDESSAEQEDAWMDDLGQVLRRFIVDIEHAYKALSTVLPTQDPWTEDRSMNRTIVKSHVVNRVEQLYVETRQVFTVPFPFDQVSQVAWQAYTRHFVSQHRQRELYCRIDDLFALQFTGHPHPEASMLSDVDWTATSVARHFRASDDRHVVVWRNLITPPGALMRESSALSTGWMEFSPHNSDLKCSIVNVCIRTVPRHANVLSLVHHNLVDLSTESSEMRTFMSQKLCTAAEDLIMVIEEIENMLMDEKVFSYPLETTTLN